MTLHELINQLQEIIDESPERAELEVFVFATETTELEEINNILMIDNDITDRIDINIG